MRSIVSNSRGLDKLHVNHGGRHEKDGCLAGSGPIWLSVDPDLASLERVPNPQEAYCLRITDSQVVIPAIQIFKSAHVSSVSGLCWSLNGMEIK